MVTGEGGGGIMVTGGGGGGIMVTGGGGGGIMMTGEGDGELAIGPFASFPPAVTGVVCGRDSRTQHHGTLTHARIPKQYIPTVHHHHHYCHTTHLCFALGLYRFLHILIGCVCACVCERADGEVMKASLRWARVRLRRRRRCW